ncbi:hypothetical protein [Haloplanus pelagicus]|jgi:hypothetical protein|uniref:hypothetical protein n=1 Tax=Haloplanus pelagicus TaxID=2949995 RepID=UPI0020425518|nr:hypothetical protein [Haloplanus sp. HW8-1]
MEPMIDTLGFGTLVFQAAIGGILLEALRRRDVTVAVNAAVAFGLAVLPTAALPWVADVGSPLALWIAVAGLLHCLGMFGLYESVWWWDHLTHTVSAGLVAALIYAALLVSAPDGTVTGRPPPTLPSATILLTVAVGVAWELIELIAREIGEQYGVEPVLVHYGRRDTALDLGFDAVGALVTVAIDLRLFVPVVERLPVPTGVALLWSVSVAIAGSILVFVGLRMAR